MWIILAISLGLLSSQRLISFILLLIAIVIGIIEEIFMPLSLGYLAIILCIIFLPRFFGRKKILSLTIEFFLVITTILLLFHQLPGFNNPKILDKVIVGTHSSPYSMYFNFDKSLVPFILLFALPTLFYINPDSKRSWRYWCALVFSIPILLFMATMIGVIKIELHFPYWIWQFGLANLFFVSLAEEALFRGYIQQRLSGWFGHILALFIASGLFGLIHFSGGYFLVFFATLAGLIYGLAWMWSGRLWISTFFHFTLNLTHLLFFTYPMYQA